MPRISGFLTQLMRINENIREKVVDTCVRLRTTRENELTIFCSGGLMSVVKEIASNYTLRTGVRLRIEASPSMGTTPQSIPQRLANNQKADVLIMFEDAMKPLVRRNWVNLDNCVPVANSLIAMCISHGNQIPDISTAEDLRTVLLSAKHVSYSDSASGYYISKSMFKKLGIESEIAPKSEMIQARPVGKIVASGRADIGFQQLSELKAVKEGITIVGPIPDSVQNASVFSAITMENSENTTTGRDFIRFLASEEVSWVIRDKGLIPVKNQLKRTNTFDFNHRNR